MSEQEQVEKLLQYCDQLTVPERLVFNKLITGSFRVGVSQQLVVKALSAASGVDEATIAHRLMGDWTPNAAFFEQLMHPETSDADISKPYPFYLAYPLEQELNSLGEISDWIAEWKWDGIRSQLIRRQGSSFIWSRGEELISESFPEILEASKMLPDGTVIDGEILAWKDSEVMPFQFLQKRISRKALNKKLLAEIPAVILAYDLLENGGQDLRREPLSRRRELLEALLVNGNGTLRIPSIQISPLVLRESWSSLQSERERSRELQVEGLMLKRAESVYGIGRRKGDWWKWKIDPYSIDAVLVAAQRGHGKRASLYTDYTFAVWQNGRLVPIAKAYSGLTDEEIQQVDAFVRKNTIEKFGPVRTVKPELVFEISFEGIQNSSRHKSGLAVRFPRIARWRSDKKPEEADTLQTVSALMHVPGSSIV
jgi:DNA ligase-1